MQTALSSSVPCLLGVVPDYPKFSESIAFQLTGLLVVLTALSLIWVALTFVGIYFKRKASASAKATAAVAATLPAPQAADRLSPEVIAVIAAAVQVSLDGSYRIQAIVPVSGQDWAHEGRRQIFSSHQVR